MRAERWLPRMLGVVLSLSLAMHAAPSHSQRTPADRSAGPPAGSAGVKPPDTSLGSSVGSPPPGATPRDNRSTGSSARASPKQDALGRLADRNGFVSRERFLRLMAERFDAADRQRRGAIHVDEARRIVKDLGRGT